MNPQEQRDHRTRLDQLERDLTRVVDGIVVETRTRFTDERAVSAKAWNDERTQRLKLAEEQRTYVDAQDRSLRAELKRLAQHVEALEVEHVWQARQTRTLWGRIGWLLRGWRKDR